MTDALTLETRRRHLFFSSAEAAIMIAGVSEQQWKDWERGLDAVPAVILDRMNTLVHWRSKVLAGARRAIEDERRAGGPDEPPWAPVFVWYPTIDDWMSRERSEPPLWRPHCSAIAELCAVDAAIAVAFDGRSFAQWLNGREDCASHRRQWAASRAAAIE